jgi:hypothetical protein
MNEAELAECYALLEVSPDIALEDLERAYLRRSYRFIKGRSGAADAPNPDLEADKERLRLAYERLAEHLREKRQAESAKRKRPVLPPAHAPKPTSAALPPRVPLPVVPARDPGEDGFILGRFDDWRVNTFVPPLLLLLVLLINLSPLKFFLTGFHVWMHEFGHATAAWLCGFRALPLPFGWTPVEPVYSPFVYWGLLLLFGLLFGAGVLERKVWPMIAALGLAGLQFYMTWRMPEHRQEFWWGAFGGVGGEFYLSTLFMLFFWVQLPDKFRWGTCRYIFFFIGATAFLNIWLRWRDVYHGLEEIPFGTMINGEDDQAGDMNKLMDGYGWKKFDIRRNYLLLGYGCWAALGIMWALFVLRLNRVADWVAGKFMEKPAA